MTENGQNADFRRKPQIFADSPLLLEIQAFGGRRKPQKTADFRRKPKIFAENRRKPQIGLCHLRCVTFSSALGEDSPLKFRGSETPCFTELFEGRPPNLEGERSPPKFRGRPMGLQGCLRCKGGPLYMGKDWSIWQLFVLCLLALRDTVPKC